MHWVKEFLNENKIDELNGYHFNYNDENVRKAYFMDKDNNIFGFYANGIFFINNIKFDFKIKIGNNKIIPFQFKRCSINLNTNVNNIESWNIGFKVINDFEYIYTIIIKKENVYFNAIKKNKETIIDEKNLLLR